MRKIHTGLRAALWGVVLTFGLDGLVWDAGLFEHSHARGERFHTHRDLHRTGDERRQHSSDHEHIANALHSAQWTAAAPSEGFLHSHDTDHWSGKFFPTNDRERVQTPFLALKSPPSPGRYPIEFQAPRARGPPPPSV